MKLCNPISPEGTLDCITVSRRKTTRIHLGLRLKEAKKDQSIIIKDRGRNFYSLP
jgi:hypothetical protein